MLEEELHETAFRMFSLVLFVKEPALGVNLILEVFRIYHVSFVFIMCFIINFFQFAAATLPCPHISFITATSEKRKEFKR